MWTVLKYKRWGYLGMCGRGGVKQWPQDNKSQSFKGEKGKPELVEGSFPVELGDVQGPLQGSVDPWELWVCAQQGRSRGQMSLPSCDLPVGGTHPSWPKWLPKPKVPGLVPAWEAAGKRWEWGTQKQSRESWTRRWLHPFPDFCLWQFGFRADPVGSLLKIWEILNARKWEECSLLNHSSSFPSGNALPLSPEQILGIPCGFNSGAEGRKEPQTTPWIFQPFALNVGRGCN